jgi:hypothetical protein
MLAGMRSCLLLSFFAVFYAAGLPVQAQVNGIAPSVTSMSFGGSNAPRGIRPSVTSLVPNSYASASAFGGSNFFLPANLNPPSSSAHRHNRKDRDKYHGKDRADSTIGVIEPVYVPFAVPYAQEADNDDSPDDYVHALGPWDVDAFSKYSIDRDSASLASEDPVAAQPSTVLVFKDGHQFDVLNYAIVGDTLFDFADGRTKKILLADLDLLATRKANDDNGVDFQIPVTTARQ